MVRQNKRKGGEIQNETRKDERGTAGSQVIEQWSKSTQQNGREKWGRNCLTLMRPNAVGFIRKTRRYGTSILRVEVSKRGSMKGLMNQKAAGDRPHGVV